MASNLQNKPTTTIQTIAYQGLIPPPDMMERFKKVDANLPERIVRMAERSFDTVDKLAIRQSNNIMNYIKEPAGVDFSINIA
jgi:uncharacterized membrane protein